MSTGSRFDAFLSNIQLTDAQIKDANNKHTGVRDCLDSHYYTTSTTGTSILVGSYGKNTACRPPTDVDILFIMPDGYRQRYNTTGGQSRLLQDVKNVLQKTYPNTAMRGDGQVVVVSFTGSFGVEVLPVFRIALDQERYYTPDTHSGGSWKTTNPLAQKRFISDSNTSSDGNTVHLIKMMKVWKYSCGVPISSFAIGLVAVPFLSQWSYKGKSSTYYDWIVRDFLAYLLTQKDVRYLIPGISELYYIGSNWGSKAETAYGRAVKACEYESGKDEDLAKAEWAKIFGGFYTGQS